LKRPVRGGLGCAALLGLLAGAGPVAAETAAPPGQASAPTDASLPPSPSPPPPPPRWRLRLELGMGLGATSATADASATAVLGLTARLGVGVGRGVSVAATAGVAFPDRAAVEGLGGINATEDLGLEVRLTHGFRPAPHVGLDRVDGYAMLPFGVGRAELALPAHRAFSTQIEQHRQIYFGLGAGGAIFLGHFGLFTELSYLHHPISVTGTVTANDGSQPPLTVHLASPGTQVMLTAGLALTF